MTEIAKTTTADQARMIPPGIVESIHSCRWDEDDSECLIIWVDTTDDHTVQIRIKPGEPISAQVLD